jgi:hypothetical protein
MSTASRLRQSSPKTPASRANKRQSYKPSPFDVTSFQDREHKALVKANQKERDEKASYRGRRHPHPQDAKLRVKNWPTWIRDGFASEIHYAVHHDKAGLLNALRSGDAHHPLLPTALEASRLGLIKV